VIDLAAARAAATAEISRRRMAAARSAALSCQISVTHAPSVGGHPTFA
jgi:hypothetical protein